MGTSKESCLWNALSYNQLTQFVSVLVPKERKALHPLRFRLATVRGSAAARDLREGHEAEAYEE